MSVSTRTGLIALLGRPLGFTLAPAMQNSAFRALGMDALYLPVECEADDLPVLLAAFRRMPFIGLAVTKPLKISILPYLDELDPLVAQIGSCNTVCFKNGRWTAHNTDGEGFADALTGAYGDIRGATLLVLGAGGASRALCFACAARGAGRILLVNRTLETARALAQAVSLRFPIPCEALPWGELSSALPKADILINATGLGMEPHVGQTPLPAALLSPRLFVCDLAYRPARTRLLADAEAAGCRTMNGLAMAVYQGARQIKLWTGYDAPIGFMSDTLRRLSGCEGDRL